MRGLPPAVSLTHILLPAPPPRQPPLASRWGPPGLLPPPSARRAPERTRSVKNALLGDRERVFGPDSPLWLKGEGVRENEVNRRRMLRFSREAAAAAVPPGREDPGLGEPLRENGGGGSSKGSSMFWSCHSPCLSHRLDVGVGVVFGHQGICLWQKNSAFRFSLWHFTGQVES